MNLRDVLKHNLILGATPDDIPIRGIQFHSNKVTQGDLFVAIPGKELNVHDFMKQAVQAGAGVLTGKGHENYKISFELPCRSDRAALNYLLQQHSFK